MTDACQRSIPLWSHGQPDEGLSHGTEGARGDSWAQAGRTRQGESTWSTHDSLRVARARRARPHH